MVVPSPFSPERRLEDKKALRREMRARRRQFVAEIPAGVRALILNRPPAAIVEALNGKRVLGFYLATGDEAPTLGWMRWFHENGWQVALPRFIAGQAEMEFAIWENPHDEEALEPGMMGIAQPHSNAPATVPDALIVPLVAFTAEGHRLGQGGGHYDRWLAANSVDFAIGLGWDVQCVESLPIEPHDRQLDAVVTPTRVYWSKS
ncbi:5-formyltetrahydrofolate cyclo-ligase [Novosphingobium sp. MW5]|nr:5-formyltetrahydrofolate cyclo-ligase [Novosphingobium sp. MW5]